MATRLTVFMAMLWEYHCARPELTLGCCSDEETRYTSFDLGKSNNSAKPTVYQRVG
ncbi:MAG: hypothetical protein R3339_07995 [Thermodesulfobacteriota bacterium]|nr:hypothetical protein [Thermodesulfobacteriota bacterium]